MSELFERIPLGSVIVRFSSIFNPGNLVVNELENLKQESKKLNFLIENNIMTASICDSAMSQFYDFVNNDVEYNSVKFHNFDKHKATDRHDFFYFQNVCFMVEKVKELNFVLKLNFTLSHGNASVERFTILNNLILENNMKAKTIIAHCFIKDCMITNELLPYTFEINIDSVLSVKNARGRYQQKLEENKSCKEKNDKNNLLYCKKKLML